MRERYDLFRFLSQEDRYCSCIERQFPRWPCRTFRFDRDIFLLVKHCRELETIVDQKGSFWAFWCRRICKVSLWSPKILTDATFLIKFTFNHVSLSQISRIICKFFLNFLIKWFVSSWTYKTWVLKRKYYATSKIA